MSNYGGKQPNNSAYIKTFFSRDDTNNWNITNRFIDKRALTPKNDKLNVYIKRDLIVAGDIIRVTDNKIINQVVQLSPDDIDPVMKLRPYKYNVKNELNEETQQYGLIADEVESLIPQLVKTIGSDDIPELKAIKYIEMIPLLLAKIQDLQKQIDGLKMTDINLQTQINEL
jgi:hypothetical protein